MMKIKEAHYLDQLFDKDIENPIGVVEDLIKTQKFTIHYLN